MPAYRARWIFPVDGPPVENGTLVVDEGRIVEVTAAYVPEAVDLGLAAIVPALVNAHTHLELSDLRQPISPALPFSAWIRKVIGHRRSRDADELREHERRERQVERIAQGLAECRASGTGLIADIITGVSLTNADAARLAAASSSSQRGDSLPEVWSFRELIGLLPEQKQTQLEVARGHLSIPAGDQAAGVRPGLSPHAPYSVHPELFEALAALAIKYRAPLAMHLAETRTELELLAAGRGELVEMLSEFGIWREGLIERGSRPLDYLRTLARTERALVIHGNYLDDEELRFIAERPQLALVYCPRTHAFFGHSPHPWRRLLELGGNLAIGTDSRASNPDLSVWNELKFLHRRHPEVDPALLLELGTIRGARALGCDDTLGTLSPGKQARFAVLQYSTESSDPYALFRLQ